MEEQFCNQLRLADECIFEDAPAQAASTAPKTVEINGKTYTTDHWYNVSSTVLSLTSRKLHLQKDHPVAITRKIIESVFPGPTYKYYNEFDPVVSTFENFDSLGFPPDHPGRARSDTYYINKDTLLRTHTSAHEAELFRAAKSGGYLLSADVYRRDEVDRSHYPVFHQMEGARVWDRTKVPNGDLAAAIRADLAQLPTHNMKELHINAGVPSQIGWAFGIGLERIAMLLFQIPDIRLFWSKDERFLAQFRGVEEELGRMRPFVPFRDCVEDVRMVDEFTHPKTGRRSLCYRINYRSLEKTLTNVEANEMHDRVIRELVERLGVEIR
ncbi:phenylalanyl-tRNA synthetase alpha subunit, mitochondrial [Collariella sp. IMI 366227]|nr:phenylalanyl-tRNA synthetase alpha subunit, mitochondrial [Collariella sp. IMI 366227]